MASAKAKIRHLFGDTFSCRALPPDILVKLSGLNTIPWLDLGYVCRTWIRFRKLELQPLCIASPSKEQLKYYVPPVFKELYPDLVSVIDCTEIRMESPSSLDKQSVCYSSYKAHTTMKALVGITPNDVVSFASELYCGSISDPGVVEKLGFLNHIQ